ncbi:single-stranded DNA-binding protein [Corynebacterium pseudopelargi]|uniref:Single-stranded DNA-binding protein n=1 Tax=Corynebacterium pseudopelargi TaxID=2080757 RepID=A0A3G6ISV9_9CORY|nr:single-stranded DNA-binding protein [Corynebacterium pseudopelargi]AZA08729.1 Single-stranded DNA-binding protein [Corynebacterium pseudopelargi]
MNPVQTYAGNLVAEPELRYSQTGKAVLNMRVAVNDSRKNDMGEWENSNNLFFNATVWGDQAEQLANVLHKGMRVLVQGKLTTRTYENKSGETRLSVDMSVFDVWLQPHRQQQQQGQTPWQQQPQNNTSGGRGGFGQDQNEEPPF